MSLASDLWIGAPVFHLGWYNALAVTLFVLAFLQWRAVGRASVLLFGSGMIVLASVASGLMGTQTHVVAGAPGATVRDARSGSTLVFPLDPKSGIGLPAGLDVFGSRFSAGLIFTPFARRVVGVSVSDARGNHLTMTQPSNASFLSPVLLMLQKTSIDGMPVHFDTFAVPAKERSVKAVLFSAREAMRLRTNPPAQGRPAILFDVVPGGIGIAASGERATIGGLVLQAHVLRYPAVRVASGPYLPALVVGLVLVLFGAIRMRSRSKT